jgi:transcriptional regulator with XRE-family HTH domain
MGYFGEWLRKAREAKGVSAYRLAQQSGLTRGYISNLETGAQKVPSDDVLHRIAETLGVEYKDVRMATFDDLYDGEDQEILAMWLERKRRQV